MTMKSLALSLLLASPVFSHEGNHPHYHPLDEHHHQSHSASMGGHESLRPHTHIAYHHVEDACAADVEKLCSEPKLPAPLGTTPTLGDPFLDWVFLPMAPPPMMVAELNDITFLIDRMMDSAMRIPIDSFIIFESDTPSTPAEHAMDSIVIRLAESKPQEIPQLTEQIAHYGQHILDQPELAERHHLARRLTEVNANDMQHQVHLPFGCSKNRCLRDFFKTKSSLSEECFVAMTQLDAVNKLEIHLEQQQDLFAGMVWVYIGLVSMLLILLARRYRGAKANRRLRIRILQTIYSNPALKAQVERELGESVGNVPPLPTHVLRMISAGGAQLKRKIFCLRRARLVFFVFLMALVFVAPFWVLPICIMVAAVRVGLLFCARKPLRVCSCCCCGVSTEDVKNGTVSASQTCCGCCKGTGVCAVACASCCGTSGSCENSGCCDMAKVNLKDCSCCCCGAMAEDFNNGMLTDCCCCSGTGVPHGMVNGCCCCCGASPEDSMAGNTTKEQAACCCCSGTGFPRCASNGSNSGDCCAPNKQSKRGRGKKHQFNASEGVYYGVPLQVV